MRALLVAVGLLAAACSPTTLAGPCQSSCDCAQLNAPIRCPGEWGCNAQKTCEYTCQTICGSGSGTDAGCPGTETCNGSICSTRVGCK